MLKIALNLVVARRTRYLMTALAIGLIVLLFVVVTSALEGMVLTFVGHVERTDADVWVLPSSDQLSGGYLPAGLEGDIASVDGVVGVEAVLQVPAYLEHAGTENRVFVSSFRADGISDPAPLSEGTLAAGDGEAVIDRSLLASASGLAVGDTVTLAGRRFKVVGITEGHQLYAAYPLVFVADPTALADAIPPGIVSRYLVRLEADADAEAMRDAIAAVVPDAAVHTKSGQIASLLADFSYVDEVTLVLQLVTGVIGALVVGVTIYTSVLERTHELGVLKAIGATRGYLARLVVLDGLLLAAPGYAIGAVVSAAVVYLLPEVLPVRMEVDPLVFAGAAALAVAVSIGGSLFGVRHAVSVDPVVAVKAI